MPSTAEVYEQKLDKWVPELETVELTLSEFESLFDYSTTLPTGKTIGKQWRRRLFWGKYRHVWLLAEYIEDPDPTMVGIKWKRITRVSP